MTLRHRVSVAMGAALTLVLALAGPVAAGGNIYTLIPVAILSVAGDYGCGATPIPGGPPPSCPTTGEVQLGFYGRRCEAGDFEVRVRQRPGFQTMTIYQIQRAGSRCKLGSMDRFSYVGVPLSQIDGFMPGKPIRLANPIPQRVFPRP